MLDVVTIDGPGGSGKGTIALKIAQILGWHYLDSGSHYRSLALLALKNGISANDSSKLIQLFDDFKLQSSIDSGSKVIFSLNNVDVTDDIRSEECGQVASQIAIHPAIRSKVLELQRDYLCPPGLVTDGRDMGTVVFPDAKWKIYLHASPEVTASRRFLQLKERGIDVNLEDILYEMEQRDVRDSKRDVAPLRVAPGAYYLDTDELTISQVVDKAVTFIQRAT